MRKQGRGKGLLLFYHLQVSGRPAKEAVNIFYSYEQAGALGL